MATLQSRGATEAGKSWGGAGAVERRAAGEAQQPGGRSCPAAHHSRLPALGSSNAPGSHQQRHPTPT